MGYYGRLNWLNNNRTESGNHQGEPDAAELGANTDANHTCTKKN